MTEQDTTLNKALYLVYSSKRSMPAHFTSNGDRQKSFCIDFDQLTASDEYEMASEAWNATSGYFGKSESLSRALTENDLSFLTKIGEDIMIGAYILVKLNAIEDLSKLKSEVLNNAEEDFVKVVSDISELIRHPYAQSYFTHCADFSCKLAKGESPTYYFQITEATV